MITVKQYANRKKPVRIQEAKGTYFVVEEQKSGTMRAYWHFRYQINGRRREKTLVPTQLDADRRILKQWRQMVDDGIDILEVVAPEKPVDVMDDPPEMRTATFKEISERCKQIRIDNSTAKRGKEAFVQRLRDYIYPQIGSTSIDEVDTDSVLAVIEPLWKTKNRTAEKCLSDIAYVLGYAQSKKLYPRGALPTAWKHNLEFELQAKESFYEVNHFAAMKYEDVPDFVARLNGNGTVSALFVHFCILTGIRNGTVRDSEWSEYDLDKRIWNIPKTKNGKPWSVPLTDAMISVLERVRPLSGDTYVFAQDRNKNKPVSENCGNVHLKKVWGIEDAKIHGFRSSANEYLEEQTDFDTTRIQQFLEHRMGDPIESAYNRRERYNRRLKVAQVWNDYCWGKIDVR